MAAAVAISPPPRSGNTIISQQQQQPPWKSHSVSRSNEFLSAARTALKIAQQHHHNRQQTIQNGTYVGGDKENELPEWMINITPATELNLFQPQPSYIDSSQEEDDTISLIQDSQTLLKLLDEHLLELHTLVRRRGHTNDPTLEISTTIEKFQEGAQEIKVVCDTLRLAGTKPLNEETNLNVLYGGGTKRSSNQRRKHYELLSSQLESKAKERTDQLKKELETRSKVLRDQTTRRKLLACGGGGGGVTSNGSSAPASGGAQPIAARLPTQKRGVNTSSQFQSPLFTSTQTGVSSSGGGITNRKNATNTTSTSKPGGYSGYAGYGGSSAAPSSGSGYGGTSYGGAGYGGTTTSAPPSFATGMRQRKQQGGPTSYTQQQQQPKSSIQIDSGQDDEDKYTKSNGESSVQAQILQRRNNRATKNRLAQARLAEKSIAELGVMFTKMSSLISQQGEVLERIEDDVEAAGLDIDAGHNELVKVYGMTKGNRGLILKVFGILIFLIVFMKLY